MRASKQDWHPMQTFQNISLHRGVLKLSTSWFTWLTQIGGEDLRFYWHVCLVWKCWENTIFDSLSLFFISFSYETAIPLWKKHEHTNAYTNGFVWKDSVWLMLLWLLGLREARCFHHSEVTISNGAHGDHPKLASLQGDWKLEVNHICGGFLKWGYPQSSSMASWRFPLFEASRMGYLHLWTSPYHHWNYSDDNDDNDNDDKIQLALMDTNGQ